MDPDQGEIYLLVKGWYEDYTVVCAFSDHVRAETLKKELTEREYDWGTRHYDVESIRLDPDPQDIHESESCLTLKPYEPQEPDEKDG